nr:hypothetical protein [Tanacetum cinerariifolium]
MNWGEVSPTHAYYNGSRTSKDNEDPRWSTSFKTMRTQKTSSALEEFILLKFWCTAIAYDPSPPEDDFKERPLKEYKIKFRVMNKKKPLTLDFKTIFKATGLDYNQGFYVSHPSPDAVKAELASIATDGKKKVKSQTVSQPKLKTQGPEALGSLPQKRKKALTKKITPHSTKTLPTKKVPTEDSD